MDMERRYMQHHLSRQEYTKDRFTTILLMIKSIASMVSFGLPMLMEHLELQEHLVLRELMGQAGLDLTPFKIPPYIEY